MKTPSQTFFSVFALLLVSTSAFAQIDIDIDLGGKEWYEEPWAWGAGVVVLLLILFLLRRPKK